MKSYIRIFFASVLVVTFIVGIVFSVKQYLTHSHGMELKAAILFDAGHHQESIALFRDVSDRLFVDSSHIDWRLGMATLSSVFARTPTGAAATRDIEYVISLDYLERYCASGRENSGSLTCPYFIARVHEGLGNKAAITKSLSNSCWELIDLDAVAYAKCLPVIAFVDYLEFKDRARIIELLGTVGEEFWDPEMYALELWLLAVERENDSAKDYLEGLREAGYWYPYWPITLCDGLDFGGEDSRIVRDCYLEILELGAKNGSDLFPAERNYILERIELVGEIYPDEIVAQEGELRRSAARRELYNLRVGVFMRI